MDANRTSPGYELKGELARLCLSAARRDPQLKLAWTNSVCIFFLVIGIIGAKRGLIAIKPVPPIAEVIPVVVEPLTLPPQEATEQKQNPDEDKNDTPRVAVAMPQAPNISFAVPTIGSLVVPANLASAPPLEPLRTAAQINAVSSTGTGGDRPQPSYPKIALEEGEQGTVRLMLSGDAAGNVLSVDVKESSGFPVLDRGSVEFIKRHWRLPAGAGSQVFETEITYKLQLN
ncbi:MAG TPA: TonB family protein [Candidatus Acidoferrales bacterium]|nr:TonB family protein [Candidatus Acidoferrales bacterium]